MSWAERMLSDEALAPYLVGQKSLTLASRVQALLDEQQENWPVLSEAVAGLDQVTYKPLQVRGSRVLAQFNPRRLVSTSARVDAASIRERPCFLCPESLPPEEKALAFGSDFVLLCNPFPVLRRHLVIASRAHTPQAIESRLSVLLELAKELGPDYFALYNGPACGASAPDHLHFQACARELFPIAQDVEQWRRQQIKGGRVEVFTLPGYRLNVLIASSGEREALVEWFQAAKARLAVVTGTPGQEPLLNLIVTFANSSWRVYFFPRGKHRPACYYAEGEARLGISPGAIDLAGVVVVPEASHFARLSGPLLEQIYAEVTLDEERFAELVSALKHK
jgi:hypothetical protein